MFKRLVYECINNEELHYSAGKANELINPATSTSDTDKSSSSPHRPSYVLPSNNVSSKPRPIAINKNNGGNSNGLGSTKGKQQLFLGLDSNDSSLDDPFKNKSFPSVKKLNLKVFHNSRNNNELKSNSSSTNNTSSPEIGSSPIINGSSKTMPLTMPITSQINTPLNTNSLPSSHENSPTPDVIKGKANLKRLSTNLTDKNKLNDTLTDLNVASRHSANNGMLDTSVTDGSASPNHEDAEANKENQNISIFEQSSVDDIRDASNISITNSNSAGKS